MIHGSFSCTITPIWYSLISINRTLSLSETLTLNRYPIYQSFNSTLISFRRFFSYSHHILKTLHSLLDKMMTLHFCRFIGHTILLNKHLQYPKFAIAQKCFINVQFWIWNQHRQWYYTQLRIRHECTCVWVMFCRRLNYLIWDTRIADDNNLETNSF